MKKWIRQLASALCVVAGTFSLPAWAGWVLDADHSRLSFVSVKAGTVAEANRFTQMSGQVNDDGEAMITIQADSVDTGIDIRDERVRSMLLEVGEFPEITVSAKVDMAMIEGLQTGDTMSMAAEGQVQIRDRSLSVTLPLLVSRLAGDRLLVASEQPVIVNAGQVGLVDGIEQLRKVAGLPSITPAVPVTFMLNFRRSGQGQ